MRFAAIDFETATPKRDSACALGVCIVEDSVIVEQTAWLIQPPRNEYHAFNISIHGITPEDTKHAPSFAEVASEVGRMLDGLPLVAHNASFDMSVLRNGCDTYALAYPQTDYYCTLVLSRVHWPDLPGYSLPLVLARCGMTHVHHDAGEDAVAAAQVLLQIANDTHESEIDALADSLGVTRGRLYGRGYEPCSGCARRHRDSAFRVSDLECATDADPSHPFYDADIAFTGTLLSMTRPEAMRLVAERGGRPRTSVNRLTEYLVVGSVEYRSLETGEPSRKMKSALALRESGCPVVILSEAEFLEYL
jgi:DNA polymerase-3 subunit epsilon